MLMPDSPCRVAVCIKQVPDTESKIRLTPQAEPDLAQVRWVNNPYDEFAIEEALKLKPHSVSEVVVFSVGPKRAEAALRTALAMGCDAAWRIEPPQPYVDPFNTARALAGALKQKGGFSWVFMGQQAVDTNDACVPQQAAELLGVGHATRLVQFKWQKGDAVAQVLREVEQGRQELLEVRAGGAVLGLNKGINTPRRPSLPGIMKAKKKPLGLITWHEAVGEEGFKTPMHFTGYTLPAVRGAVQMLQGEPQEQARLLVESLKHKEKVLSG